MKNMFFDTFSLLLERSNFAGNFFSKMGKPSLRILYYHMVSEVPLDYYFGNYIEPHIFQKQLKYFKKRYDIISMYDAIDRAERGESLEYCLSITFDDGFSECYSTIAPILLDEKVPATFFLIENSLENRNLMWRNKLILLEKKLKKQEKLDLLQKLSGEAYIGISDSEPDLLAISDTWEMSKKDQYADFLWHNSKLKPMRDWLDENRPYLSVSEIKEMHRSGFHFGSHTRTHPRCDCLTFSELEDEIAGSIDAIGKETGIDIDLFSYPFGLRASPAYEAEIFAQTGLKCMLGIRDTLANCTDPSKWERVNLEKDYSRSISHFYLVPIRNRYFRRPLRIGRSASS